MIRIAIVGGGPGGLLTSYLLDEFHNDVAKISLFESSHELGGKVITKQFLTAPVTYEAGLAELYDYSRVGPDPLYQLIKEFGFETTPMHGRAVIFKDKILRTEMDFGREFGADALKGLLEFYKHCSQQLAPADYYEGLWITDNAHQLANTSYAEFLDVLRDDNVRRYVEIIARSDVATEPHLTTALDGLKNLLMDHPAYMGLYSVNGGNQRIVDELEERISADVRLDTEIVTATCLDSGGYKLGLRKDTSLTEEEFDIVVLAMPNQHVKRIQWGTRALARVMENHLAAFDRPAHYLRVCVLFQRPFWRLKISGAYFMSDSFGGCCIYDEGQRHPSGEFGVLSWLICGNDAMVLANLEDSKLLKQVLDSLPPALAEGRALALEVKVHRWVGAINALPGGNPVKPLRQRHQPDEAAFPNLYLVGDYLFDSTLNGVLDSADYVSDLLLTRLRRLKYVGEETPNQLLGDDGQLNTIYHDLYDGTRSYEESLDEYFDEYYVCDLIKAVWGRKPPYKLLDCGSANGLTLARFEDIGIDAWGIENSAYVHAKTPKNLKKKNILGDVKALPFKDNSFDFIYETCLCYLSGADVDVAIRELLRVCKVGIFFGSITSDMRPEVIEQHDLFEGVATLTTLWDWSERFISNGFHIATCNPEIIAKCWMIEVEANEGGSPWYPDAEALRFCFYSKTGGAPPAKSAAKKAAPQRVKKA
jgi:protoporphyrinogen oxidase/SAM-dependent methyltransferase